MILVEEISNQTNLAHLIMLKRRKKMSFEKADILSYLA
jgi:hypothetical protein